jgi:hypothetical protein
MNMVRVFALATALLLAACTSTGPEQNAEEAVPTPSASASAETSATPSATPDAGVTCPSLLACMKSAKKQSVSNAPDLVYHYSESVHPKSKAALEALGAEYLGVYAGFYESLSAGAKIHVFLSLDPAWCGVQLVPYEYGTAKELEKSPACTQDGGANAGRSRDQRKTAHVILRPHPSEVAGVETGNSKSVMLRNIFVAELGHASRALRYDSVTPESGPDTGAPIWLQYLSNEAAGFLVGVSDGMSESQQDDYSTWWGEPKRLTWRPTYSDSRLNGWTSGSGIFATASGTRIVPNHYNLAFMAARYLIPKHGLSAIQNSLIGTIFATRGNLDAGAVALGYADWNALIVELDEAMFGYYAAAGVVIPEK